MKYNNKTILAQSTPIGNGGIGIIRISGNECKNISKIMLGKITKNRYAEYLPIKNKKKKIIDYVISIFFKKPNSFTGEDVLEIHSHGGQKVIELIIKSIINLKNKNIRIANPGEFTERAFINNKIDLIQAESIKNIIYAQSEEEIFSATKSFKGILSKKIKKIIYIIKKILIIIEKEISFSEKNINIKTIKYIKKKILYIYKKINYIYKKTKNDIYFKKKIKIIIIGPPNVGKSSLMNKLTSKQTSIVTNISGTTRDIIKEYLNINNIDIEIIDTAGIHKTKNKIEKIGIKKTWKEIKKSKIIIYLNNSKKYSIKKIIKKYKKKILDKIKKNKHNKINILIRNKIDLTKEKKKIINKKKFNIINMSVKKNYGIKELKKIIKERINKFKKKNYFIIQYKQKILIKKNLKNIKKIINYIKYYNINKNINLDIIYQYLVKNQNMLNKILGKDKFKSNNIIKEIFSKFCIGK